MTQSTSKLHTAYEQGQIIIITLVFMFIMMSLSTVLLGYTTVHIKGTRLAVSDAQALELAQAGIDKAIYELNQNAAYTGEAGTALGAGVFSTVVTSINGNNKYISSTGYIPNSTNPTTKKTIKITATIDSTVVAFRLGMQVGVGGMVMNNGSKVIGNVFSNGNVSGIGNYTGASGEITESVIVAAGTSATPDVVWTTYNADFTFGDQNSRSDVAQSFAPVTSNKLNKIGVYLNKVGSPGDIAFKLVTDNSGSPTRTVLGSGTIYASLITPTSGYVEATFTSPPDVTAGTKYWLVLDAPVDNTNYFNWGLDNTDGYASQTGKYSPNWNTNNPTWTAVNGDFNFRIYMGGITTQLSGIKVSGDATAQIITDCNITGKAYYQAISSCPVGGISYPNSPETPPQLMPISDAQVQDWKASAALGGTITTHTVNGYETLGPIKITGDLIVNGTLNLNGNVWVEGNVIISNGSFVQVDNGIGANGAVVIADTPSDQATGGIITVSNNSTFLGNNTPGSYVLMISTNTADAIVLNNNTIGGIFYSANGTVVVSNNVNADRVLGKTVHLENNAIITYSSGLQSGSFPNGPGGSWAYVPGTFVIAP